MMRAGTKLGSLRMLAIAAGAAMLLAACGSASAGSSGSSGSPQHSGSATQGPVIGTETVSGVGTVLDTSEGLTLYYNTREAGGKIVCTGSCADVWPPLVLSGAAPALPSGVQGTLGTVHRPDGTTQLTFDGYPLYTYAGDSSPGMASGQGLQGIWYAAPASGIKAGGSGSGSRGY